MATLILVRHGESIWNRQNRFTGWVDVSLSRAGIAEAERAAVLLGEERLDVVFTSALLRAQDTAYEILKRNRHCAQYVRVHDVLKRDWYEHFVSRPTETLELKIYVSEMLNERYYGDLQGMRKDEAAVRFGSEQVHQWRRSYDIPPPNGESLQMTADSDDVGHLLRFDVGHLLRFEAGRRSDLMSATLSNVPEGRNG